MKTSYGLIMGLLACNMTFAKAPVTENHSLNLSKRVPAQVSESGIRPLEHYMDSSCTELVAKSEVDGFSKYLKVELSKLDPDFCSLVGEIDGEDIFSQAEQRKVGLGTFSKLVEGHYHEYAEGVELTYFQDKSCEEYMQSKEDGSFSSFFKKQLIDLGSDVCSRIGNFSEEDGRDKIGLGTYSKLVESAFWDFNSREMSLR